MSRPAGYLNQVDACRFLASERLRIAKTADDTVFQARLLVAAVEFAVRSVLTAWSAPAAKPDKLWTAFEEVMAPLLGSDTTAWVRRVHSQAIAPDVLLGDAEAYLASITSLSDRDPPVGWTPPHRSALDWRDLAEADRTFLAAASAAARAWVPEATLWLFGSRATGTARTDSDYDVLLVVPNQAPDGDRGQAMGAIWMTARGHQVEVDHSCMTAASLRTPDGANATLAAEVRAYGIEVPIGTSDAR